jgi:hypothetical protein
LRLPSRQLAGAQTCWAHRRLRQSWWARQAAPLAHGAQVAPPQSTSVSSPSRTPSLQLAGGRTHADSTIAAASATLSVISRSRT